MSRSARHLPLPSAAWLLGAVCIAMALVLTAPEATLAQPALPSGSQATVILTPTQDTYVDADFPTVNYAAEPSLIVEPISIPNLTERRSLLQFDLSALPPGSIVTRATLQLLQTETAGTAWLIDVERITGAWDATKTTWQNPPPTPLPALSDLAVPAGASQRVELDITPLVQGWTQAAYANFGIVLRPGDATANRRAFASADSANPPQLVIELVDRPFTPASAAVPTLDGKCESSGEYARATTYRYLDVDGLPYSLFLLHSGLDLYVCAQGLAISSQSVFAVHLDTDVSPTETATPNQDDFALQIQVSTAVTTELRGTGDVATPYERVSPGVYGPWEARSSVDGAAESAEFRIPVRCYSEIALAVFHRSVRTDDDDAGWPSRNGPNDASSWAPLRVACPIRVCAESAVPVCTPALAASVYPLGTGQLLATDAAGYVTDLSALAAGDQLWALAPFTDVIRPKFTVNRTLVAPVEITPTAFEPGGEMTLVVTDQKPLVLHDLEVATQWTLTPAQQSRVAGQITAASNLLYDFTDGQFALGRVTVHQNYEQWENADLWVYASNNLRPKATAGGVVETVLTDPDNDLEYYPGRMHMGSYWNRYHKPEGEPIVVDGTLVDPLTLANDWPIVLAHEWGHYGFFLFDTYFGLADDETLQDVFSCTGSAMGWVYETANWAFVHDPAFWSANCAATQSNQLLNRDEWATLLIHYPWLKRPLATAEGPAAPPVPLTGVRFVAPANPGSPLAAQDFDLLYENAENASRKALAYLYRDDRVMAQGNVPKGSTQIALTGAQAGDILCVYDIDAAPPAPDTARHQYGCETLTPGDTELDLERDPQWRPIVLLEPLSATSIGISVTQPAGGAPLRARLFPEHSPGSVGVDLITSGVEHTAVFDLPGVTPSAYVQVFVDEEAIEGNPRREAMAMYGVDGGAVPGPSKMGSKAPVVSPDGESSAWPLQPVTLAAGEWVAMQYMVETFPTPAQSTRLSNAYRVISWPRNLFDRLVVTVETGDYQAFARVASPARAAGLGAEGDILTIRYWRDGVWVPAATTHADGPGGGVAASAVIPADAVYALFEGPLSRQYLPALHR